MNAQVNQLNQSLGRTTQSTNIFGQALKGAFVGALVGFAVRATVGNVVQLGEAILNAGKNAVVAAGDFQLTRNAMELFTGSASSANRELAELAQLAKDTPGLRLEDAQTGATRLRALGFQAKVASDLVAGIAKQKLISGVDDEGAVNRVIVNLQQLRAGSPQIQRDIQQMILSIPSLSKEINIAFGSLEKFKTALRRDPNSAIEQFSESLKNAQAPAAGFNDGLGKLLDSFVKAGRAFGEPILDPLLSDMQGLTDYIEDNLDTWTSWGQGVADAIRGASNALSEFRSSSPSSPGEALADKAIGEGLSGLGRVAGTITTAGLSDVYRLLQEAGTRDRLAAEKLGEQFAARLRSGDIRRDNTVAFGRRGLGQTDVERENEVAAQNAVKLRNEQLNNARIADIKNLELGAKEAETILKNRYETEQALLDTNLRYTSQQELDYIKQSEKIKANFLKSDLARIVGYYDKAIALQDTGSDEQKKLIAEKSVAVLNANAQITQNELRSQLQIKEQERKIYEERRQALIQFKELQIRESKLINDAAIFNIERQIDISGRGYDELASITQSGYETVAKVTIESYRLQLQSQELTAEQRVNLEKQMQLDLTDLAEQNRQKILNIQDRQLKEQLEQLQRFGEKASQVLTLGADRFGLIGGALGSSRIDKGFVKNLGDLLFGGDIDKQFDVLKRRLSDLQTAREKIKDAVGITSADSTGDAFRKLTANPELATAFSDLNRLIFEQEQFIGDLNDKYAKNTIEVFRAAQAYEAGAISIEKFQEAQLLAFDSEGRLRLANYSSQIDNLRSQLNALPSDDKKRFGIQQAIDQTLSDQTAFAFTQAQKRIEFYRQSIAGLTQELNKLKNADPATLRQLDDQFRGEKLQEQIGQYTEIYRLKYDLANSPYINSLEIERSYLEDLVVLRNQETEAIIAGNRSRLEIAQQGIYSQNRADASVLQFLVQQKGITEIVSDTKINLLTTAYSGLELVADKLTRKFGAFRDVIKDLISNLLKLALNKLFGGFLTGGQSGGGFSVGGSGQQGGGINLANLLSGFGGGGGQQGGGILSGLTGSFGSGGGFGGTPAFGGGSGLFGGLYGSGAAGTSNFGFNAPGAAGGGLLSQASAQGSSLGGLLSSGSGGGGIGGLLSGLGSALPFLGATLGASVGGSSIGGNILGGIGGLLGAAVIPGLFGSAAGAGVLGGIGGIFGLSAAAFAPIAAVAAPLLIAGAYFLARDKARKRDERTRNQLMLDSLSALDKLIEGVNNDRIDGPQALEQADQIREQYVEQATALKDKKTRGIALKDVSRLDIKISELKSAIAAQTGRRERLELLVPTFASGGPASGYQSGSGHGTSDNIPIYFPAAGRSGYVSPTEYILDAQTTSAIGVNNLDVMRATKGRSYSAMRKRLTVPRMASGGTFVPEVNPDGSVGSGGNGGPMTLELAVQVGLSTEEFVRVISSAIVNNNGSRQNINAITKTIKNGGDSEFTRVIAEEVRKLLQ